MSTEKAIIVLVAAFLLTRYPCRGEEFVLDASRLDPRVAFIKNSDLVWGKVTKAVVDYSPKIVIETRRKIVAQLPSSLGLLYGAREDREAGNDPKAQSHQYSIAVPKAGLFKFGLWLRKDADSLLHEQVPSSLWRFIGSNRISTVSSKVPCLRIPHANFVAHFDGYDSLNYCYNNLLVAIDRVSSDILPDEKTYLEIVGKINGLFEGDQESLKKKGGIELVEARPNSLSLVLKTRSTEDRSALLEWSAQDDQLTDHWIRVDSDAGRLAIESNEQRTVSVRDIPLEGVTVHIYAISPDGGKWYWARLTVK